MKAHSRLLVWLIVGGAALSVRSQDRPIVVPGSQTSAPIAPLRLEDLERLAGELNPTLAQAAELVRAAAGRRTQAGLYPNPIFGYEADEFSLKAPGQRSQNYLFLEQRIVTAGKIGRRHDVQSRLLGQSETRLEIQRIRLLNDVRAAFYRALGAQQSVGLRRELAKIAKDAVGVSEQLFNIGQADQPDVLAVEVEAEKAELDLANAEDELDRAWSALAGIVGKPELPRAALAGELEIESTALSPDETLERLLKQSPEIRLARNQIDLAAAALALTKAQRFPDLFLRGGLGYNQAARETQALFQAGITLPLFDRNQGAIAAASAELDTARLEARRVELVLRSRFAAAFLDYKNALQRAQRYKSGIIPRAQKAYDLYLARFRQMTASYPQVLISQRTLFQSKTDYIEALVDLRQSLIDIEGMLLSGGLQFPGDGRPKVSLESGGPVAQNDRWR